MEDDPQKMATPILDALVRFANALSTCGIDTREVEVELPTDDAWRKLQQCLLKENEANVTIPADPQQAQSLTIACVRYSAPRRMRSYGERFDKTLSST